MFRFTDCVLQKQINRKTKRFVLRKICIRVWVFISWGLGELSNILSKFVKVGRFAKVQTKTRFWQIIDEAVETLVHHAFSKLQKFVGPKTYEQTWIYWSNPIIHNTTLHSAEHKEKSLGTWTWQSSELSFVHCEFFCLGLFDKKLWSDVVLFFLASVFHFSPAKSIWLFSLKLFYT